MCMTVCVKLDPDRLAQSIQDTAAEKLKNAGEIALDFSSVLRVDTNAVKALEEFAQLAAARSVEVQLHGVNLEVYKVLKLVKLDSWQKALPDGRGSVTH